MVDKSSVQCFNCQKLCHFAGECNANKKEPQVARQEFDDESKILVMITEGECIIKRWQDSISSLKNIVEPKCNRLQFYANQLHAKENVMVTLKEAVQCN